MKEANFKEETPLILKFDVLAKSQEMGFSVIPAEAGIQGSR